MEQDIYDQEVERLSKHPEDIDNSWLNARPLFRFVGDEIIHHELITPGCLTMIRSDRQNGAFIKGEYNEELTKEIRNDRLIPSNRADIQVKDLLRFAYWQRRIDALNQQ